jgi:hypothetical protein
VIRETPLDIFRVDQKGVLWVESAATFDDAKARIQKLAARQHSDYLVLNHLTGKKILFDTDCSSTPSSRLSHFIHERTAVMD